MANVAVTPQSRKHGVRFEQQHVQYVYDEIATSMNNIQHKAWPNVKRFLKKFQLGSLIADIGCGNGRYLNINSSTYKVGVDVCTSLVENARTKGYEVAHGDNLHLPFRSELFDGLVSIGVIHHFCSCERRVEALSELARVLRVGGKMMIYVWAYEQKHRKFESQDVLIPWHESRKGRQTRTGSASSVQSFVSSTSSVSEDEFVDQSTENSNVGNISTSLDSAQPLHRRTSLSADDVPSLVDLSNFKANYYSLDFSTSPQHKKRESDNDDSYVWNEKDSKTALCKTKTNQLIKECRKLESSLRALSAGSLDVLDSSESKSDFPLMLKHPKLNEIISEERLHHSLSNSEDSFEIFNEVDERELNVALDWTIGDLESDDFEAEIPSMTENHLEDTVVLNNSQESPRLVRASSSHQTTMGSFKPTSRHPMLNPFLKENSLDTYTFNSVNNGNVSDDTDSIEVISDNMDGGEEVSVEFKPVKTSKSKVKTEKNIFGAVKSKILELFQDKSVKKTHLSQKPENDKSDTQSGVTLGNSYMKGRSDLTLEQIDLATRLNFKVREFPLSSCPDVVCDDQSSRSHYLSNVFAEIENNRVGAFSKGPTDLTKGTMINQPSLIKNPHNEFELVNNTNQLQNGRVNGIYDGYIKIDIDGNFPRKGLEKNGRRSSSALDRSVDNTSKLQMECDSIQILPKDDTLFLKSEQCLEIKSIAQNIVIENKNASSNGAQFCNTSHGALFNRNNIGSQNGAFTVVQRSHTSENHNGGHNLSTNAPVKDDSVFDEQFSSKLCRYYHVFREGEIEALISNHVTNLHIVQTFYDHGNWCIIAEKI